MQAREQWNVVLKVLQAKATTTAKKVSKKSVPSENIFQGWRQKTILFLDKQIERIHCTRLTLQEMVREVL